MPETPSPESFQIPDDLTALSGDELASALTDARAEFDSLRELSPDQMTDEQVNRMDALADFADAVAVEDTRRVEVAAERQARVDAAAQRMDAGADAADEGEEGDGAPEGDAAPEADDAAPEVEVPEALAAGGSLIRKTQKRANPMPKQQAAAPVMSMIASADVGGGIQSGATLPDMVEAAKAFISRSKNFPGGKAHTKNVRHQHSVLSVQRNFSARTDGLYEGNRDFRDLQSILEAARSEKRLSGGSLVASGGWCAPSETLYGMCQNESLDGIIDLPEIGINRGGINYTPGPDFSDIYTSAGFAQTEAEAIAGTTKSCVEVDCPDFSEVRLDAVGICVKAPLLTKSAYPEAVARWIEGTMVADQHKVGARLISAMRTALGSALVPTLTGTPVTWSTLTALELIGEGQRQAYRLSDSETLEVVAPKWLRVAIRSDLANRMGIGADSVTNAQIQQHFADRNLAVQWVRGYLEISSPLTAVTFPSSAEVMVYPAGTFVKGTADVISLDTVYDTADLQTNVYTAAFVEDGVLLAKMCHGGVRITIPVHVTGMLGAAALNDDWGTAQS